MGKNARAIDKIFLILMIFVFGMGLFTFISASLSIYAESQSLFYNVLLRQIGLGIICGGVVAYLLSYVHYSHYRKYAWIAFIVAILLTCLVWVPGLGMSHAGATRWITLGFISFQPSEILKLASVLFFAAYLSYFKKEELLDPKCGLFWFVGISALVSIVLYIQPDADTMLVIVTTLFCMYFIGGASWRDIFILILIGLAGVAMVAFTKPHVKDRIVSFMNPSEDLLGAGYQANQARLAIGSGQFWGRGYGQGIQKYGVFLPEPVGDSVFATFAEEHGFFGVVLFLTLLFLLIWRGIYLSARTDRFGRLLGFGIMSIIAITSLVNIGAIGGVIPLAGLALPFMSHGGTALFILMVSMGIMLNISRHRVV